MAELGRYQGNTIAEPVGVVRLQDDATAGTRALIRGSAALGEVAGTMLKQAEALYLSNFDIDQQKKAAELRAANPYDPEKFKGAWQAHGEGTLAAVPSAFRARAQITLKSVGEGGYESVLLATAAKTQANAEAAWKASLQLKENELLAVQRAGKDQAVIDAAGRAYQLHLEDGVRLKVINEDGAKLYRDAAAAKHAAESVGDQAYQAYLRGGRPAAEKVLRQFETDPAFATIRTPVTVDSVRTNVGRRIAEARADAAAARGALREGLDTALQRLAQGWAVDVAEAQANAVKAEKAGDKKAAKMWNVVAVKGTVLAEFGTLTLKDQQRVLAEKAEAVAKDPASGEDAVLEVQAMQRIYQRTAGIYQKDRFEGALRTAKGERPAPVDFTGNDWADIIAARRETADRVSAREGASVVPLFTEEKIRAAQYAAGLPASQKTAFMAQMDKALGPYARQFWSEIAGNKAHDGERMAATAMVAREDPALARDILDGRAARAENQHYAPKDGALARSDIDGRIGPAFKNIPGARETYMQEVLDIAAKMAKDAGDTSGSTSYLEKAFEQRFGASRLPSWRGVRTVPPDRGADISQWMGTLTDMDLGGALPVLPSTGRRVTAAVLARNGRLYSAGSGLYTVELDGETLAGPDGKPFVLSYWNWKARMQADDARRGGPR